MSSALSVTLKPAIQPTGSNLRSAFEDYDDFEASGENSTRFYDTIDLGDNYTEFLRGYEENPEKVDKWTKIDILKVTDDPRITIHELQQMNSTLNGKGL